MLETLLGVKLFRGSVMKLSICFSVFAMGGLCREWCH